MQFGSTKDRAAARLHARRYNNECGPNGHRNKRKTQQRCCAGYVLGTRRDPRGLWGLPVLLWFNCVGAETPSTLYWLITNRESSGGYVCYVTRPPHTLQPCPSFVDYCDRPAPTWSWTPKSNYLGPDTMSGPTLSPVSLLCATCDPSHRGKVPDFQHLFAKENTAKESSAARRRSAITTSTDARQ